MVLNLGSAEWIVHAQTDPDRIGSDRIGVSFRSEPDPKSKNPKKFLKIHKILIMLFMKSLTEKNLILGMLGASYMNKHHYELTVCILYNV